MQLYVTDPSLCQIVYSPIGGWTCTVCHQHTGVSHDQPKPVRVCTGPPSNKTLCRHLGQETRLAECASCCGNIRIKVFECALHLECTLAKQIETIACCQTCADYGAAEPSDESSHTEFPSANSSPA